MKKQSLTSPPYGNCRVLDINSNHIFNCSKKKCKWYLSKELAIIIQEEPLIIKLTFITNGPGHIGNEYYLQEQKNVCVVCGIKENLTKHHIVPYSYRRYFKEDIKSHNSFDILPLCVKCHEKYEEHANLLKKKINQEFGISESSSMYCDREIKQINLYASALIQYKEGIPFKRKQEMMNTLRSYYGREITVEDLEEASKLQYNARRDDYTFPEQIVVAKLTDIEGFVKRWRKHFISMLKPRHLPEYWTVDFPFVRKK